MHILNTLRIEWIMNSSLNPIFFSFSFSNFRAVRSLWIGFIINLSSKSVASKYFLRTFCRNLCSRFSSLKTLVNTDKTLVSIFALILLLSRLVMTFNVSKAMKAWKAAMSAHVFYLTFIRLFNWIFF